MPDQVEIPGLPSNVTDLMDTFSDGAHFDANFASDIMGAADDLPDVISQLQGLGDEDFDFTEETSKLTSIMSGSSFSDMSSFITNNIESVFDNASLHQTVSSIESALGQAGSGACPGLTKAFGPFLSGRSMLDGLKTVKDSIAQSTSLKGQLDTAKANLTSATAEHEAGHISDQQLSGFTKAVQDIHGAISDVRGAIRDATNQIHDAMSGVNDAISDANDFVNKATAKLSTFTSALKINNLTKDPCIQAVLGAVASPRMLDLIL